MRAWVWWLAMWLTLGGCAASSAVDVCRPARLPHRTLPRRDRAKTLPPHRDYAALKLRRSYVRVVAVGDYADHFMVLYHCYEGAYADYAVTHDAQGVRHIIREGSGFPAGRGTWPKLPPGIAEDAAAVVAHFEDTEDGRVTGIRYLGRYRAVWLQELIPSSDGAPRRGAANNLGARVNKAMDGVVAGGALAGSFGGGEGMFYPVDEKPPYWIDVVGHRGVLGLWTLARERAPDPAPPGYDAYVAGILAGVRRFETGEPRLGLDALAVHQGDWLVPPGVDDELPLFFSMSWRCALRDHCGAARGAPHLSLAAVLAGGASTQLELEKDGIAFHVHVTARAQPAVDLGAPRQLAAEIVIDVSVIDAAGHERHATARRQAQVAVEDGRAIMIGAHLVGDLYVNLFFPDAVMRRAPMVSF